MFLRNAWYVAAWDREIGRELMPRTVLGVPIVFFRAEDGAVAALEDRCCHRSAPLSAGRLKGSEIECGYHGLRFDRSGPAWRCRAKRRCRQARGSIAIPWSNATAGFGSGWARPDRGGPGPDPRSVLA